jgi:hypothetical protein
MFPGRRAAWRPGEQATCYLRAALNPPAKASPLRVPVPACESIVAPASTDAGVDSIDVLSETNAFAPEVRLWTSRFAGHQTFRTAASVILLRRS